MKCIFFVISIAILLAGCDSSMPEGKPIVCFGDSLTEGYGAGGQGIVDKSRSYPAFLQRKVTMPVVNSGISGDTTAGALARLERDVLSKDPQMVIILLGANDFFQRRPMAQAKADLQEIIDRTREEDRKIYLASFLGDSSWETYLLNSIAGIFLSEYAALLPQYIRMFDELMSENRDLYFIPNVWTGINTTHMSDPIHPNASGYERIAQTIYEAIR